jgi:hypothetical protein
VVDIDLEPGGRSLLVADRLELDEMSLTDGSFTPRLTLSGICNLFQGISTIGNGKVFINTTLSGSGVCPAYFFDLRDQSLVVAGQLFANGYAAVSGDGNHLYADVHRHDSPPQFLLYDATTDTQTSLTISSLLQQTLAVSGDASRVILSGINVFDAALHLTGSVPGQFATPSNTAVAYNGSRAFLYAQDAAGGGPRVEIYDLNGALQAGAQYPRTAIIALADAANLSADSPVTMIVSPDDRAVVISGDTHLLIVPVPSP